MHTPRAISDPNFETPLDATLDTAVLKAGDRIHVITEHGTFILQVLAPNRFPKVKILEGKYKDQTFDLVFLKRGEGLTMTLSSDESSRRTAAITTPKVIEFKVVDGSQVVDGKNGRSLDDEAAAVRKEVITAVGYRRRG